MQSTTRGRARRRFELVLIKPSHYDDSGYVIQWVKSAVPSNALAMLNGLALDCAERQVLGQDVDIVVTGYDETNTRIRPDRIARRIQAAGGHGMVALVGVQSNQFPRAMDIARPLREAGIQVCIGGFHVSGCLAMLPELPADLKQAQLLGISLFAGESEGRLDAVLQDADRRELAPLYNYLDDLVDLTHAVHPILPADRIKRNIGHFTSFDAGRGCPFECSFCTIINVQGRHSRRRSPEQVEKLVRANTAQNIHSFFITDDNFARNKDWEAILDRLIVLREEQGILIHLTIQVDTLCHRIPRFIEKCGRAGVRKVFIGLESINPESLAGAKKRQNKLGEYRRTMQAWRSIRALTVAGYIVGFPNDTPESVAHDIEVIKRELPVDMLMLTCMTPLPGSADHRDLYRRGAPMDADMNRYDLTHVTMDHAHMSRGEWERTYQAAWDAYYTPEHIETIMRRGRASGISVGKLLFQAVWSYGAMRFEGVHPMEGGYLRRRIRTTRRPGLPLENALSFYPTQIFRVARTLIAYLTMAARYAPLRRRLKRDLQARNYSDVALNPVSDDEAESLLLSDSEATRPGPPREARAS
ncbi:MAG: radical SAM protein [Myxococcota bacterium]